MDADVVTAIGGIAAVVVTAAALGLKVHTDHRAREDAKENQEATERQHRVEASKHYLNALGSTCALLDGLVVDADNADDLISKATTQFAVLQGIGQSELVTVFGDTPPVVWADRACRRILDQALTLARHARKERQTGEAAQETSYRISELVRAGIDNRPREVMRWALREATERYPQPLLRFEGHEVKRDARVASTQAGLPLSDTLLGDG